MALKEDKNMKKRTRKPIIAMALALILLMASVITIEFCKLPKAEPEGVVNKQSNLFGDAKVTQDTKAAKATKVKKPGQVKTLKKVNVKNYYDKKSEANAASAKIKFSKVKGATGYQVLLYRTNRSADDLTPLVFAFNTKKTTYTIKNLVPDFKYTIKVRAYTKGKDGKIVYGKTKSLKIKTGGKRKGWIFVCNTCGACVANMNLLAKHGDDVYKIHHELHCGYTFYMQ